MIKKENLEKIKLWIETNIKEFTRNEEVINIYNNHLKDMSIISINNGNNIYKKIEIANIDSAEFLREIVPFLHSINFIELYDLFKEENFIKKYYYNNYYNYSFIPIERIEDSFSNKNGYSYAIDARGIIFYSDDPDILQFNYDHVKEKLKILSNINKDTVSKIKLEITAGKFLRKKEEIDSAKRKVKKLETQYENAKNRLSNKEKIYLQLRGVL